MKFPRIFNRSLARCLIWCAVVVGVAFLVNAVGLALVGDVKHWSQWLQGNAWVFFCWRLVIYAGVAWGWLWMRRRVLAREDSVETRQRLRRVEVGSVFVLVLLEAMNALNG
jgi:hypothetical protein